MMPGVSSPKIDDLINELFSAILSEQKKFNKVLPPDEGKKALLKDKLDEFIKLRGRTFFYNYMSTGRGHGPFTELIDGSVKYDLIEGIGFNLFGHSPPFFVKSCLEAAAVDTLIAGNLLSYEDSMELTKTLLGTVKNSRLKHFWFACSGSMANDIAMKLIWQKKAPKYGIIAFEKAFAGRSIATQEVTYNEEYRTGMPQYLQVKHVPHYDYKDPKNALKKTLTALDKVWAEAPDTFAAMVIELVQGEAGFVYGTKEYYEGIFQWAKKHDIYVWVDEVQTFGRTHQLFAHQMFGLDQYVDMVTIAKALQCAGALYTEELNPKPGLIAGTFAGSMANFKAGKKGLEFLLNGNFYGPNGRMAQLEQGFISRIKKLAEGSCRGKIGYYGGIGLMLSFEIGDSSKKLTEDFLKKLFDNGVIAFSAGKDPMRVRFLPPVSLTDEHLDDIFRIIEKTIKEVL